MCSLFTWPVRVPRLDKLLHLLVLGLVVYWKGEGDCQIASGVRGLNFKYILWENSTCNRFHVKIQSMDGKSHLTMKSRVACEGFFIKKEAE